jgi:hypothetical protein
VSCVHTSSPNVVSSSVRLGGESVGNASNELEPPTWKPRHPGPIASRQMLTSSCYFFLIKKWFRLGWKVVVKKLKRVGRYREVLVSKLRSPY